MTLIAGQIKKKKKEKKKKNIVFLILWNSMIKAIN